METVDLTWFSHLNLALGRLILSDNVFLQLVNVHELIILRAGTKLNLVIVAHILLREIRRLLEDIVVVGQLEVLHLLLTKKLRLT